MYYVSSIMHRNMKLFFLSLLVACYLLLVTAPKATAQTMSNQNYIIQTDKVDTVTNSETDKNSDLQADKNNPAVSGGVNFKIKAGFKDTPSDLPFSISLSSNIIDFGTLSPTNPIIRTVNLSTNSLANGYSVIVFENEPLTAGKTIIPDTTCDFGSCGIENASIWINALAYGFGYRCDNVIGSDCDNSFTSPNFYKHFPNIASNDDPQIILSGIGSNNKEVRVSYKVNISGSQAQSIYKNIVTYIAIPNF